MSIELSLIIPAYNEAERLPRFLESVRAHLDGHYRGTYEVVVVDDGSRDGLFDALQSLVADWRELTVLQYAENRGKGAAVRWGVVTARGERLLFADADGATPIGEEAKLSAAILAGADVAVGSRLVAAPDVARRRTLIRGLVGRLFASAARWWLGISVRDTQCGFKMFRRDAGIKLFLLCQEAGYLFDLELLGWAERLGLQVREVPVTWTDMPGGHLSLARESSRVLFGLYRLKHRLQMRPITWEERDIR